MKRFEQMLTTVMAMAAITVAVILVKREFAGPGGGTASVAGPVSTVDSATWVEMVAVSRRVGDAAGREQIVVFADYECPACRGFHAILREVKAELPDAFEVRYLHSPLEYHRFALPSARVAECAAEVGAFTSISDVLFDVQDSLGLLSWSEIVDRAKVPDSRAVAACASADQADARFARIGRGLEFARSLGTRGTPTVVIAGTMYSNPPLKQELLARAAASATSP